MDKAHKKDFLAVLEKLYGGYKHDSSLFGSSNFSTIAADLCYSNSHFSKLISGGASDAMYERAIKNLGKLQALRELKEEASKYKEEKNRRGHKAGWYKYFLAPFLIIVGSVVFHQYTNSDKVQTELNSHPLDVFFKFNDANYYKSPYLNDEQVHEYCPGSAFEGRWELEKNYIIPIPYKIRGLYYVGKSADIRLKCRKSSSLENRGKELIGFENIHNEIWFDKSMTPVESKYFDSNSGDFTTDFKNIDFENTENFVKIANVYSCFYDEILITKDSIFRKGEHCGRYANSENNKIHKEYNLDLNHIIEYIIGNMIFANCQSIKNDYGNPNDLTNGKSTLVFPCRCSINTENLGLGGSYPYSKTIKLIEQNYQSNLFCKGEQNNGASMDNG